MRYYKFWKYILAIGQIDSGGVLKESGRQGLHEIPDRVEKSGTAHKD
jgi:hypothetical protein